MKFNVKIRLNKNIIYEAEVEAHNEMEAMCLAYDQLDRAMYAEATMIIEDDKDQQKH